MHQPPKHVQPPGEESRRPTVEGTSLQEVRRLLGARQGDLGGISGEDEADLPIGRATAGGQPEAPPS